MYESYFGISGPPFQLSADPAFYFDSLGHRQALADLRRGLATPAAVVVVSGEIGAGKTMLVRTVLSELDTDRVTMAQIVSSQLDAPELLQATLAAFGVAATVESKPDTPAGRLRQYLEGLAAQGRRAVLIVDEAQNLGLDALSWLGRMVSDSTPPAARLQVCLVGQPELRALLGTPEAASLRQALGASCHLGPLDKQETRAYIEHRLRKVGWSGKPRFEMPAFDEIHRWTSGIPRRINLLCNRLLLTLYLASQAHVDAHIVAKTAKDLRAEVGDEELDLDIPEPSAKLVGPVTADVAPVAVARPAPARRRPRLRDVVADESIEPPGPMLFVVATRTDCMKLLPVLAALAAHDEAPVARLVCATRQGEIDWSGQLSRATEVAASRVDLSLPAGSGAQQLAELTIRFDLVMAEYRPPAVWVIDGSDVALACGLVANRRRVPVVHVNAGVRSGDRSDPAEVTRVLVDHLAELLYASDDIDAERLHSEGIAAERVQVVGNVLVDALQGVISANAIDIPGSWRQVLRGLQADRHGYGLVVVENPSTIDDARHLSDTVMLLRDVSRDMPLLWPVRGTTQDALHALGLNAVLDGERIARIAPRSFEELLPVLNDATCLFTDDWSMQEAATALRVPCLTIGSLAARAATVEHGTNTHIGFNGTLATRAVWEIIFNGGKKGAPPAHWDGRAGHRIGDHFVKWLAVTLANRAVKPRSLLSRR